AYVRTQFSHAILYFWSDNQCKFDNAVIRSFFSQHDIIFHLSCPYTSQQNGKAECILRILNDCMHTLLLQAFMPC
ncbi:hypothetical protein KKJ04_24165, partial [Xenorhabdus bovienii]|uniref:hypothetical protein n=1 Tax=Xenorhabdus bovienii TaxID=40576 RepID=UPI0023B20E3C